MGDLDLSKVPVHAQAKHTFLDRIEIARNNIKQQRCVIASICRNLAGDLAEKIRKLISLGDMFADYRIVIYENDSDDSTPDILNLIAKQNSKILVQTEKLGKPRLGEDITYGRAKALAEYRNRYLSVIKDGFDDYDKMIVIDLDLQHWWLDGILHSLSYDHDAMTANGIQLTNKGYVYYDTWTFVKTDTLITHLMHKPWYLYHPLVKVKSAFGGLGIYKIPSIMSCEYKPVVVNDVYTDEHVGFHFDMIAHGHDEIYVNPTMLVER